MADGEEILKAQIVIEADDSKAQAAIKNTEKAFADAVPKIQKHVNDYQGSLNKLRAGTGPLKLATIDTSQLGKAKASVSVAADPTAAAKEIDKVTKGKTRNVTLPIDADASKATKGLKDVEQQAKTVTKNAPKLKLDADVAKAKTAVAEVENEVKQAVPKVKKHTDKLKQYLDGIKSTTGKRSGIGELVETLRGAGAILAIGLIARGIEEATSKAAELTTEFRNGKISAQDFARGMLESLPILGSAIKAAESIREMITGERAAQQHLNEVIEDGNALYEQRKELEEKIREGTKQATDRVSDAADQLEIDRAHPGIERQVVQKQKGFGQQQAKLLEETSPYENKKRLKDEDEKVTDAENAELKGAKSATDDARIRAKYDDRRNEVRIQIEKYNHDLAARNKATIRVLADATEEEIKELKSGTQEILSMRESNAKKLAETKEGKLENFRAEKQAQGYEGPALDNLIQVKKEELATDAMVGTRNALRSLNDEYRNSSATTFDDKVKANKEHLEELASRGEIAAESIDELQAAFERTQRVAVENTLKEVQVELSEIGKTDVEKQVDQLKRLGATAEQAAKYAADLKEKLTAEHVQNLTEQAHDVGLNPLEKSKAEAARKGEDPGRVGQAEGALLGKELAESVKTPFEAFEQTIGYYRQLLAQGDISQRDFMKLQSKAFEDVSNSVKTQDIHGAAVSHLQSQFAGYGVGLENTKQVAADKLAKKAEEDKAKKAEAEANKNGGTDPTHKNTGAIETLTKKIEELIKKGFPALYA